MQKLIRSVISRLIYCPVLFLASVLLLANVFLWIPSAAADPYPPVWSGGSGAAIHFQPAAWPNEPANPADCGHACGEWKPYTRFQREMSDPRVQDPSNGGTSPQNYVNIASSCIDKTLPSIYYNLYKHPSDSTKDVIMFRWRVEQIANTYATGPSAGNYGATDPWNSALWTVLFDVDGDGYRDIAAHLDGSSGSPSTAIDRLFGIWGNIPTQSIDYTSDPNIHLLAHNPTSFIGSTNKILNFHNTLTPNESWPNGASETLWDYGTTRAELISTNSCNEYFIDYQIPVALLDATGLGGPEITRDTPISMLFCTANSLNNPFQKDCAINKKWVGDAARPAPFGDYLSFNETAPYSQPIVSSVTATAPSGCPGNYSFTAKVQDTIAIVNGVAVSTVKAVNFYYYYDTDGDGSADDGNAWILAAQGTLKTGSLNIWTATWNATSLPKGKYLIGVQAIDAEYQDFNSNNQYDPGVDVSLLDDGMTPTENHNRTFSYMNQAELDALIPWPSNEFWYANPDITGMQVAVIGVAINSCGVAPTLVKTASAGTVVAGATVDFTLTISNPMGSAISVTQITDTLPPGFNYVNSSTSGDFGTNNPSLSGQTLTWALSPSVSIPGSGSKALTFTATASTVTGTYTNTVTADTSFGILNSDPVTIAVGSPRLTIAKAADATSYNQGDTVTYTITYSNDSPVDVTNVLITDILPTGVTYVSGSASNGGTYENPTRTLAWNVGRLPSVSGSRIVTFQVTVDNPYSGTVPLVNTASIDSDQTTPITAQAASYINVPYPNIVLQKSSGSTIVSPGSNVTFTISYANAGTANALNVAITDIIPTGFSFISATGGGSNAGGTVTWNIGTVNAGSNGSVTLTLQAGNPYTAANPQSNTASVTWTGNVTPVTSSAQVGIAQSGTACDTYYFDNQQQNVGSVGLQYIANTTLPTGGTVNISKCLPQNLTTEIARFYQDPVSSYYANFASGSTITGQIYYTKAANGSCSGSAANANMTLTVRIYDYDPVTGTETLLGTSTYTDTGSPTPPVPLDSTALSGALQKGHRLLWVVSGTMPNNKNTYLSLSVHDSRSNVQVCAPPPAELVIDKQADKVSASAGDTLTYTIRFSNIGQAAATGAQIVDTLPAGVTFQSATLNGSPATPSGTNPYTFTVNSSGAVSGTVAAGASGTLIITATVNNPLNPTVLSLTNTASLSSSQTAAISDTAKTGITGRGGEGGTPNLTINKIADKTLITPGDTVTYTLTLINSGTAYATNIQVTDDIPDETYFVYVNGSISGGDSRSANGSPINSLNWTVNGLAPGASATLSFQMQVSASGVPDGITTKNNSASLTCTQGVTTDSNTVTVSLNTNPNLSLSKNASPSSNLKPGDTVTYTLVISNSGSGAANDVVVTDPVPNYTSFATITQGSGYFDSINNRIVFAVGTLASGGSTTLAFTVTVNSLPSGITTITNSATVTSSNTSSRTASASVNASANPILIITKTGPSQVAYPVATLTADVSNSSTLFVSEITQFIEGQYVSLNGTVLQILSIAGNAIIVDAPVTGLSGDLLIGTIAYSVTYQNKGDATAIGVVLTDAVPPGSVFIEATGGGTESGGVITWNLGDLDPNADGTVQVVIIPANTGTITNNAEIDCTNCAAPLNASVSTSVGGLRVTKSTTTPVTPAPGIVTYSIQVENTLGSAANGVTVTDTLPAGFSYASTTSILINGNDVTTPPSLVDGSVVTWSSFTIPAGEALVLTFTANVAASVGAATYQNDAGADSSNTSVIPFDPLLTTAEDVTVLAAGTGIVEGYVFQDNNYNGIFDPSIDTPLPGVSVNITDSTETLYIIATDSAGYFRRVVASGEATVDINDADIPSGLTLGSGFSDPESVTVPDQDSIRKDTGYINVSITADLVITKTDGMATSVPGQGITYTITVTNNGPSNVTGATVADTFPGTLSSITWTCSASAGSSCTASGSGSINHTANILNGGTLTYTVTTTVNASATGSLSNTATVTSPAGTPDPTPDNNSATDTNDLTPSADLSITKSDGDDPVFAGNNLTYTITVNNAGPSDALNVVVTDTLPAGVTFGSTSGCTEDTNGVPTCSLGTITAGGNKQYTVTVTVNTGTTGTLTNNVSVTSDTADPDGDNNSTSENTAVSVVADLAITKTDGVVTAVPGQGITYTITVTNNGPSNVTGATVADTFPGTLSGITWTCAASAGSICTASGSDNISDTVNILSGGTLTYTVTVTVSASATGSLSNTATVSVPSAASDPTPANNSATDTDTLTPSADLSITKSDSPDPVIVGQTLTYTITVNNAGPSDAANMVVTDTLPAGVTFVSTTGCAEDPNGVPTCSLGTITAGGNKQYTVTITVNAGTTGTITNNVSVTSDTSDPVPGNNSDSEDTTVNALADLAITKTADDMSPGVGDTVVFTLSVTNNGPSNTTGVQVTDILPSGVTYVSDTSGGDYVPATGIWNIGPLNVGSTVSIDITVTANQSGRIINIASITATDVPDPDLSNNSSGLILNTGANEADLAVIKEADNPSPLVGDNIVYTITVANNGPDNATGVALTDLLPAGLTYISDNGGGSYVSGTGVWTIGALNVGSSATLQITAQVVNAGEIINTARVTASDQTDPDITNNQSSAVINQTEPAMADLAVQKIVNQDLVDFGDNVVFTVVVRNNGPDDATNVVINDLLPAGMNYVSSSPSKGSYDDAAGEWTVGTIPAYGYVLLDIVAQMNDYAAQTNTASVGSSDTFDPDTTNNVDDATVNTIAADLSITKSDSPDPVVAGQTLTYTVTVNNAGPSDAVNVVVTDTLPAGVTFVSTTGCTEDPNGVPTCSLGTITAGGSKQYTITVTAPAGGGTITNNISVSSDTSDPAPGNNSDSEDTTVNAPSIFDPPSGYKTVSAIGFPELVWRMVWINDSVVIATAVTIIDPIPVGTTYVAGSLICQAQGASVTTNCVYDNVGNRVIWEGIIAPDPGATDEATALNEVVISYRTSVPLGVVFVQNQGCANWDANGNGSVADEIAAGQIPVCSDDPATSAPGDPTIWELNPQVVSVPTLSEWGIIILLFLQGLLALYFMRRRTQ
jgi:uncharacterized repeat protein (TIGR01451 family)